MAMRCPVCENTANVRTSRYISDVTKETYYQCRNIDCSCTFKTVESVSGIIRRPLSPDEIEKKADAEAKKNGGLPPETPSSFDRNMKKYGDYFRHRDRHAET